MKVKALASAIIGAAIANQAMALDINSVTPDLTLVFSGATAVDLQFQNYIDQRCLPGTLDTYLQTTDAARAYFCTVSTSAGNKNVLFRKESGGSSRGVAPIAAGLGAAGTVEAIDLGTCSLTATANEWDCSNTNIQVQSQVGISDVEPALFTLLPNTKPGETPPNLAGASLTVQPVNINTFGVVATPGLRDALQAAQGLTVGSEDVADMPSLSSNAIAALFAGDFTSWNSLVDGAGNGIASGLADPTVNLCLRTPGSGTQAQFNAFYMGIGCAYNGGSGFGVASRPVAVDADGTENNGYATTIPNPINPAFPPVARPKPYAYWNNGSSDMGKCLTSLSGLGRWAVGIQSIEKVAETRTDRNEFRYLAIDGVAPTLENVASGLYRNVASASIQWNDAVVNGGLEEELAQDFVDLAQEVSSVAASNAAFKAATGAPQIADATTGLNINTGNLVFPVGGATPAVPFDPANPVAPFNQGLIGPSSCATSFGVGPVDVSQTN